MDNQLFEVHRLAQAAQQTADRADHKAETAVIAQSTHEKLCSERYQDIKEKLVPIIKISNDIGDLRVQIASIASLHRALVIISLAIGVIYTILKITGHA